MLRLSLIVSLAFTAVACVEAPSEDEGPAPSTTAAAVAQPSLCPPNNEPVPRPGNQCTFEVSLDQVINLTGQGISEGAMETNVSASADGAAKSWPSAMPSTRDFVVGQKSAVGQGYVLGTYSVAAGNTRKVKLCSTFTEVDNGGANGQNDVGTACTSVTLRATAAPGNKVVCTSSPAAPSVSATLCGPNQCNGSFKATFEVMIKDADVDGVENDQDFTPDVCDEQEKGKMGRASLIYFHMGDGPMTTFFQGFGTDLGKAMVGYDYKVIVMDPTYAGPFLVNAAALNSADLILSPYEANLYLAMQEITKRGYDMDIWIFSHGSQWTTTSGTDHTHIMSLDTAPECTSTTGELCWNGIDDDGDGITDEDLGIYDTEIAENLTLAKIGTLLVPIRMVYSIACFNEGMNWAWNQVGAKVVSGTEQINFYPVFYGGFADAWNAASTYASSVVQSDKPGDRNLVEFFISNQGVGFDCDDISLPNDSEELLSVLDLNLCAQDFFVDSDGSGADLAEYDMGTDYNPLLSGRGNMDVQSTRITDGDGTIKKFVPAILTW